MTPPLAPQHPLVKRARRLAGRKGRREESAFLAEGLRVVLTALERGAPVESLLVCPEQLTSPAAEAALSQAAAAGLAVHRLSPAAMAALSQRDNPVGLAAIITAVEPGLESLEPATGDLYIALEEASDPGNLGTVLRTLDAAGASGLVLAGHGTDPFHPTAVKASLGALWTVPWATAPDLHSVLAWAARQELTTVATSARGGEALWSADLSGRLLLLFGSERHGLTPETLEAADRKLTIPMTGSVTSLNLAVAVALVTYEARRVTGVGGR